MKTAWTRKLLITSLAVLASCVLASPLLADSDDPPGRVARLSYLNGSVSFQPSGEDQWSQASVNYPLTTGDRIFTDRDARAEVETGNVAIRLSESTDLTTANLTDELLQLGLAQGTLRIRAFEMVEGNSIEIDTSNVALTVLRPGSYRVEAYPDDNTTMLYVISGDVQVNGNGISQVVHSGQALKLTGTDDVQADWVSPPRQDDFDEWCGERDRRFLGGNTKQYVSTYSPGYHDLDEYGRWDSSPEYGHVWYPTTVAVGWAPYRYGRWVWIEPWGWTWVAEEPWGFTPFHYGRWVLIGSRWGWCPGPVAVRPIYAPALVAFVGGPRASISVWFPLGPRDPYFPAYHHSDVYLRQVNVTNVTVRNVTVINNYINVRNERNVTNIRYQYQRVAPTAVSTEAFRSARPVHREMVRLNPDEIGRARVIPHPEVTPDVRAIHGGAPAARPPVVRERPKFEERRVPGRDRQGTPGVGTAQPGQPGRDDRRPGAVTQTPPAGQPLKGGGLQVPAQTPTPPMRGGGLPVPKTEAPKPGATITPPAQADQGDRGAGRGRDAGGRRPGTVTQTVPAQTPPPQAAPAGQPMHGGGLPVPAQTPGGISRDVIPRPTPPVTGPPAGTRKPFPVTTPPAGTGDRRAPDVTRTPPPAATQPAMERRAPDVTRTPPPAAVDRRPIVTNNPPPPQKPSFERRQPEMQKDPGRPLEPRQMENLQRGQPVGTPRDREFPPHQASPRANPPAATAKPNPPAPQADRGGAKKDDKKDDKQDKDRRR